ncbi:MAG: DUF853 family protein [Lachnospiraceae bacterium]|nr:DUF853 family protein [Lachnospiraceae bacterium]
MGFTKDGSYVSVIPKMANRHGLIAGATGTGKTITLKVMAESFSDAGVPVFLADVKGDLAGMCMQGENSDDMLSRIQRFGLADKNFGLKSYPTRFWDIYGVKGMPLRTTVTEFGPLLLSRLLGLNQIQSDILNIVFKIADDEGLLIIDIKDLKSALNYCAENASQYKSEYGSISKNSVAAIMRALVSLEDRGGDRFFGEPAINVLDWFKNADDGRGYINILDSESLINDPLVYSTFLLWMIGELFEQLPEVGDPEKPRMVFFFDEAHLLFADAPKVLLQKIEQVVKLIRSKGVGVYFVTQNPKDIPDSVLAQLGNKVQHALRAYTPSEQKGIKAAAESFRENPDFSTEEAIKSLGTGEAIVSFIQDDGSPSVVQIASILPPQSRMGSIDNNMRAQVISMDFMRNTYNEMIDRDSAYEFLLRKTNELMEEADAAKEAAEAEKEAAKAEKEAAKAAEKAEKEAARAAEKAEKEAQKEKEKSEKAKKQAVKNVASAAVGSVGRELGKSVGNSVGGSLGKTIGGNVGASLGRGILSTLFKL